MSPAARSRRVQRGVGEQLRPEEALARELEALAVTLKYEVAEWLALDGAADRLAHHARRQQLIYGTLRREPGLARRVLDKIEPGLRRNVRAHLDAGRKLRGLVTPMAPSADLTVTEPAAPRALRRIYEHAESSYGVPWHVLAAINFVESRFGRVVGPSAAGALGPMQFVPTTWETYGEGGDIMDPRDAILAAARYLKSLGADEDIRFALFSYNRSEPYVDAVLTYASEMESDETSFYAYYFWRVVVATTDGDVSVA
jgi:Transglycosylase SLT domain